MYTPGDMICEVAESVPEEWQKIVMIAMTTSDLWSKWLVVFDERTHWSYAWFDDPQDAMRFAHQELSPRKIKWHPVNLWRLMAPIIKRESLREAPDWDQVFP